VISPTVTITGGPIYPTNHLPNIIPNKKVAQRKTTEISQS